MIQFGELKGVEKVGYSYASYFLCQSLFQSRNVETFDVVDSITMGFRFLNSCFVYGEEILFGSDENIFRGLWFSMENILWWELGNGNQNKFFVVWFDRKLWS